MAGLKRDVIRFLAEFILSIREGLEMTFHFPEFTLSKHGGVEMTFRFPNMVEI